VFAGPAVARWAVGGRRFQIIALQLRGSFPPNSSARQQNPESRAPTKVDGSDHGTLKFRALRALYDGPATPKMPRTAERGGCPELARMPKDNRQRAKIYLETLNGDDQPTRS
jgi:hypothetical protein